MTTTLRVPLDSDTYTFRLALRPPRAATTTSPAELAGFEVLEVRDSAGRALALRDVVSAETLARGAVCWAETILDELAAALDAREAA